MQLKKGVKHGEQTFLVAVCAEERKVEAAVPSTLAPLLEEFRGVMPPELPKRLPPRREVDHKIELTPGAKPLAMVPYRMGPAELKELRRQLDEMLDTCIVRLSKAHLVPQSFFR